MTATETADAGLSWDVLTIRRPGLTRDLPAGKEELMWVANSSTLIHGERNAVLVDTFLTTEQSQTLLNWVVASGKNLTAIYVTHAHGDHFFGLAPLLERFPHARAVATPEVVKAMHEQLSPAYRLLILFNRHSVALAADFSISLWDVIADFLLQMKLQFPAPWMPADCHRQRPPSHGSILQCSRAFRLLPDTSSKSIRPVDAFLVQGRRQLLGRHCRPSLHLDRKDPAPLIASCHVEALAFFDRHMSLRHTNSQCPMTRSRTRLLDRRRMSAPRHSITSSARASSSGGTVRPSIRAVSALMTSSNLLDCTTGRSARAWRDVWVRLGQKSPTRCRHPRACHRPGFSISPSSTQRRLEKSVYCCAVTGVGCGRAAVILG